MMAVKLRDKPVLMVFSAVSIFELDGMGYFLPSVPKKNEYANIATIIPAKMRLIIL